MQCTMRGNTSATIMMGPAQCNQVVRPSTDHFQARNMAALLDIGFEAKCD